MALPAHRDLGVPLRTDVLPRALPRHLLRDEGSFTEHPIVSRAYADPATPMAVSVRTSSFEYIKRSDTKAELLYDLGTDARERVNLSTAAPDSPMGARLAETRRLVGQAGARPAAWRKAHPARPAGSDLGAPGWLVNREQVEQRDEIERKLRSLGYVE